MKRNTTLLSFLACSSLMLGVALSSACGGADGDPAGDGDGDTAGDGDGDPAGDGDGDPAGDGDGDPAGDGDGDGDPAGDGDGDGDTCEAGELSGRCLGGADIEVCNDGTVSTYSCAALCAQEGFSSGTCAPSAAGDDCACTNDGPPDGALGSECSSHSNCDSAYCRVPPGGFQGTCAVNDFGQSCQDNSACEYNTCIGDWENDDYGYCTTTCESFTDCPTFWECGELGNAAGTYCLQP